MTSDFIQTKSRALKIMSGKLCFLNLYAVAWTDGNRDYDLTVWKMAELSM